MLQFIKDDIYLNQQATDKRDAITQIAQHMISTQCVKIGYDLGMLERESQSTTYLGAGIAIPHGSLSTRNLVNKTSVSVFHFPEGISWGENREKAYLVIGIAANTNEHLTLLKQLTHVLSIEHIEKQVRQLNNKEDIIALLSGALFTPQTQQLIFDSSSFLLDIPADSLTTLQMLNVSRLKTLHAVDNQFIVQIINQSQMYYLGQGVWINSATVGSLKDAIVISRAEHVIVDAEQEIRILMTVSSSDTSTHNQVRYVVDNLATLAFNQQLDQLWDADAKKIISLLTAKSDNHTKLINKTQSVSNQFIVKNNNGLHVRPSSILVSVAKSFTSDITITNLDGSQQEVNAKNLMKVISLGAKKGDALLITATGEDMQQAIQAIGDSILGGLGEDIK